MISAIFLLIFILFMKNICIFYSHSLTHSIRAVLLEWFSYTPVKSNILILCIRIKHVVITILSIHSMPESRAWTILCSIPNWQEWLVRLMCTNNSNMVTAQHKCCATRLSAQWGRTFDVYGENLQQLKTKRGL